MRPTRSPERFDRASNHPLRDALRHRRGRHPVRVEDLRGGAHGLSAQLSPDGMYYWDGQRWVSTLSHDGRTRWNGTAWMAVGGQPFAPAPYQSQRTARRPTSWTRPMQYAVAGWYVISALFTLTVPFWMGGMMSTIMTQSFQRQEQLNPNVTPPPPEFIQTMTTFMNGVLWVSALFGAAICAVFVLGALRRWRWTFYAVLVL